MNPFRGRFRIITLNFNKKIFKRNWRPITMLTLLVLVVCDSFGLLKFRLSNEVPQKARDKLWTLLQIGLGGYVVGRTGEKIVEKIRK